MAASLFVADHYRMDDDRSRSWLERANQSFPPRLFDATLLGYFVAVFDAALEHCNARDSSVALASAEPERAVYAIEWS